MFRHSAKNQTDKPIDNGLTGDEIVVNSKQADNIEDIEFDDTDGVCQDKLKKLRAELKSIQTERAEYLAGWQRAKADYLNLKREADKEKQDLAKFAREGLLHELLPLADSFDLAMNNRETWEQAPPNWRQGVEYIYSQLQVILRDNGLEPIDPLSEKFDPIKHHCLATIETDKVEDDDKVLEVLKKGYIMNGKVVRPAQVKVGTHHLPNF
ncbi:MAG: Protein GrpE [Candidatus Woesebacteria bacterium GW2011_GWA1_39_21b]|uniref:Protein GrpE n=3 Tax=Patescibacteria group TaxID=1783273 RepID=A0A1G2QH81_9BACT|nr:MAG: Protein GrpE [Candidatus Woesebacteria bacterium GW2011_GWA1_39_21b]KKS77198.1 MAG: Protein GrpE [Parcubacteria group bacterium GW2011_GWB1_42_9]KKS89771.1 MAG: Protein GrpE [Parcubacteria group bacterium GW2011_GWC1_43_11b]OHA59341.1 MAG: nucleotide exchange factor GrpE [Candidatus Vogelbacteria bacterium RIFOXYB1_FULL_42_16]OHA60274.1 MAG: nucleotide exchange factor GrpE [Candidatus Vogelbacteria bacterium RIFOXYD1_FULL_42_15]